MSNTSESPQGRSAAIKPGDALSVMRTAARRAFCIAREARRYLTLRERASFAKAAHRDAVRSYARGDYANARRLALNSLAYSVGVSSEIYKSAEGTIRENEDDRRTNQTTWAAWAP